MTSILTINEIKYKDHNKNIEDLYDLISKEFDISRVRIWNKVKEFLVIEDDNKKLLDVGTGNSKNYIYAKNLGYDCIGTDISNNLINIGINKGLNIYKKDVLELKDTDFGKFNKIICIAVIHHLETIELQKIAIINMINCLYNNGELLLSVWSIEKQNILEYTVDSVFYEKNKNDYRDFILGPNYVDWKYKQNIIKRFYYIHNYDTFNKMFMDLKELLPISYTIYWEKQNWFCRIKLHNY
jgi:2-polyprenyl-3-methyl-5-hydroxy-6-metoxy-1,4-benzoquinol methylase